MTTRFYSKILFGLLVLTALNGCRTPPPPARIDPELERRVAAARSAYAAGFHDRAAGDFNRALQRARLIDSNSEISRCAYNLAVSQATLRQWDAASGSLEEAVFACSDPDNPPVEFTLLRAKIARGAGRAGDAIAITRAWLNRKQESDNENHRVFQVLLAGLLYDSGDHEAARAVMEAIPSKPASKEMGMLTRADFYRLSARLARQAGETLKSAVSFDEAAEYYRKTEHYPAMAACLADAGRAWLGAGETQTAVNRLYRAARSMLEQGDTDAARELIKEALPLAAEDTATQNLLQSLAAEI